MPPSPEGGPLHCGHLKSTPRPRYFCISHIPPLPGLEWRASPREGLAWRIQDERLTRGGYGQGQLQGLQVNMSFSKAERRPERATGF